MSVVASFARTSTTKLLTTTVRLSIWRVEPEGLGVRSFATLLSVPSVRGYHARCAVSCPWVASYMRGRAHSQVLIRLLFWRSTAIASSFGLW